MGAIATCDECHALHSDNNPVMHLVPDSSRLVHYLILREPEKNKWDDAPSVTVNIRVPDKWVYGDICLSCQNKLIASRFAEIAGLVAPYRPERIAGLAQIQSPSAISPADRELLLDVKRLLLKAETG